MEMYIWKQSDVILIYHRKIWKSADIHIKVMKHMGYFKGHEDYCVNGFALKDMLHENSYTISLRSCPEFIEQMSLVIGRKDIIRDYERNSRYYCLEYLVPMDKVIFDGFSYKT